MSEFKPINTQEELDALVRDRLEQKERSVSKKYEGYISPEKQQEYESKITSLEESLKNAQGEASKKYEKYLSPEQVEAIKKEYDTKIANYETDSVKTRVAIEMKLPLELKDRLKGATEEEIREDDKSLVSFTKQSYSTPGYQNEPSIEGNKASQLNQGYKNLISGIEEE